MRKECEAELLLYLDASTDILVCPYVMVIKRLGHVRVCRDSQNTGTSVKVCTRIGDDREE
jgi:hypothetical protein